MPLQTYYKLISLNWGRDTLSQRFAHICWAFPQYRRRGNAQG